MAKAKTPRRRSKRQIEHDRHMARYASQLSDMRYETKKNVKDVIEEAVFTYPVDDDTPCGNGAMKHKEALFDGILEALAETVVDQADAGGASLLGGLVSDRLKLFVEAKTCGGRA